MRQTDPRLLQVKAAAGSGKTYSLTLRFLSLLSQTNTERSAPVCTQSPSPGFFWDEIMAVTFTNKAAMEMKERIVRELKKRALELDGAAPETLDPRQAARLLDNVLRRYSRLNIRTIDSLLNLIVRIFALPLGLSPDFDLIFSEQDVFEPVYREFAQTIGTNKDSAGQLEQAALTLIRHDNKAGFWLAPTVCRRLATLVKDLRGKEVVTDQRSIATALQGSFDAFSKAVTALNTTAVEKKLPFNSHFTKFLNKCRATKLLKSPPVSKLIEKDSLCECVLSKGKGLVDSEAEQAYARLQLAHEAYRRECAVLSGAYSWGPLAHLASDLRQAMEAYQVGEGIVLCDSLAHRAAELLSGTVAAPEAFCRLGNRLHHLLIDEFQDTSRDQWNALLPLGEECLSKLGSLFYVGDVKQAIYSWRGGDSSLFDEVVTLPELVGPAGGIHISTLDTNWRSCREIVNFNNDFFKTLCSQPHAEFMAEQLFSKADSDVQEAFVHAVTKIFTDCEQKVPDKNQDTGGYVRLQRLPGGLREDIDTQTKTAFMELMEELDYRGSVQPSWGDVAVLVRTNTQAQMVSQWLVAQDIPVITENSLRMGSHPVIAQLAALLHFIDRPEDNLSFAAFISGEDVFLPEAGLSREHILEWLAAAPKKPLYLAFREDFPKQWTLMEPLFAHAGMIGPYDMVAEAISAFRLLERRPDDELFIRRLLELAHRAEEKDMRSLSRFLNFWQEQGTEETVPLPQDVNAVQVMTMHKAKGLEFPIVILPFMDWALPRFDDELAVVPMGNAAYATPLRRDVGELYWEKCLHVALEHCNLLYVAFTRPRNELYGFFPADRNKTAKPSPVLCALESVLGESFDNNRFELGSIPAPPPLPVLSPIAKQAPIAERPQPERDGPCRPMTWLPRLRVYRNLEDTENWRNRQRGEIVHKALEYLLDFPKPEQAVPLAVGLAVDDFPLSASQRNDLAAQTQELVSWLLSRKDMHYCLRHGRPEAEIIDPNGRQHRVDLLCFTPDGPIAVEYKTGATSPDHIKQVRRYLSLLDSLPGSTIPSRGLIVYLDKREIIDVVGDQA